jgi:hypothetical protein
MNSTSTTAYEIGVKIWVGFSAMSLACSWRCLIFRSSSRPCLRYKPLCALNRPKRAGYNSVHHCRSHRDSTDRISHACSVHARVIRCGDHPFHGCFDRLRDERRHCFARRLACCAGILGGCSHPTRLFRCLFAISFSLARACNNCRWRPGGSCADVRSGRRRLGDTDLSWHWLFLINMVLGVVSALSAWLFLPRDKPDFAHVLSLNYLTLTLKAISLTSLEIALQGRAAARVDYALTR